MSADRHSRLLALTALAAVMLVLPAVAAAQSATSQPAASGGDMPGINDVVNAVDRAASNATHKDWSAPVKMAIVFAALALLPSAW